MRDYEAVATVETAGLLTSFKGKLEMALQEVRFHHAMEELTKKHGKQASSAYEADLRRSLNTLIEEAKALLAHYEG